MSALGGHRLKPDTVTKYLSVCVCQMVQRISMPCEPDSWLSAGHMRHTAWRIVALTENIIVGLHSSHSLFQGFIWISAGFLSLFQGPVHTFSTSLILFPYLLVYWKVSVDLLHLQKNYEDLTDYTFERVYTKMHIKIYQIKK